VPELISLLAWGNSIKKRGGFSTGLKSNSVYCHFPIRQNGREGKAPFSIYPPVFTNFIVREHPNQVSMNKKLYFLSLAFLLFFYLSTTAQNLPCSAISLPGNMTDFQTYSTLGLNNSGVPNPYCGAPVSVDIWFAVTAPPSGDMDIATLSGTMANAAMALYLGPCNNLTEIACADDDNCNMTIMPVMQFDNLIPGQTYYIRIWPEGGGGTFQIRVTDGDPVAPPLVLSTVGNATQAGPNCVQLTANTTTQLGCAWEPTLVDFSQPFTNTVNLNFGTNDGGGADGICMIYHNDPNGFNTCGTTGGGLGAIGIQNSFIIEFDTWDNGAPNSDIPQDHVAIDLNGSLANPINGPVALPNLEDGQDHEVSFSWNPITQSYTITVDGIPYLSGNYDIVNLVFGGTSNVYCGFSASTGAATNTQSVCSVGPPIFPAGSETVVDAEICQGEFYIAGGGPQTTSGTYFDFFQAFNGCDSLIITNLTVNPTSLNNLNETICEGECVTINGTQYCDSGFYSETTSNYLGCDSIINLNLLVLAPEAVIAAPSPITCAAPTSFLDGSGSAFGPGMSYNWTGPNPGCILGAPASPQVFVNCPGSYTLTVTHSAGNVSCTSEMSVEVVIDVETVDVDIAPVDSLDCSASCVTLDASNSTQGANYTYSWSGPDAYTSSELNPTVCDTGSYTLIIENPSNGCFGINNVQVAGDLAIPVANAGADSTLNCLHPSIQLSGTNNGNGSNVVFEWLDENGNLISPDTSIIVDQAAIYILSLNNQDNGCTDQDTIVITDNFITPTADAGSDMNLDCTLNTVTLDGSNSESGPEIAYEWQTENGQILGNSTSQTVSDAGLYSIIVTNTDSGCSDTAQVNVVQDQNAPIAESGPDGALTCAVTQYTLDGTNSSVGPNITYTWEDENQMVISQSPIVTVNEAGTYILIVENTQNNCIDSSSVFVASDTLSPVIALDPDTVITCAVPSVILGENTIPPGANWQFNWEDENGNPIGNTPQVSVDQAGLYSLSILDTDNSCAYETAVLVDANNTPPLADAGSNGLLTCSQDSVILDGSNSSGSGILDFYWEDSQGNLLSNMTTLSVDLPDQYTLIIEEPVSGCLDSALVEVLEDVLMPSAEAGPNEELNCYQPQLTIQGQTDPGNIAIQWLDDMGNFQSDELDWLVDQAGIYTLEVTNLDNGCTNQDSVIITASFVSPVSEAGADQVLSCTAQSVELDGQNSSSGPEITYQWLTENGVQVGDTPLIQVDEASSYTLLVTDTNNGCTSTDTVIVDQDADAPLADAGTNDTLNCLVSDVVLDGGNSSAGPDFIVEWENLQGTPVGQDYQITVNEPGIYTLTVTNTANGCVSTSNVEVSLDTLQPTADPGPLQEINCYTPDLILGGTGTSTGPEITYLWEDNQGTPLASTPELPVNTGGNYTLTVFNNTNNCSQSQQIFIPENLAIPMADAGNDIDLDCLLPNSLLDGTGSSQGMNIEYEWMDENAMQLGTSASLPVDQAGTYILEVLDVGNGCLALDTVVVSSDFAVPLAEAGADQLINCNTPTTILSGNQSSSGPEFEYTWTDDNQTLLGELSDLSVDAPGTYYLTILNTDNGCEALDSVAVSADFDVPLAEAGANQVLNCYSPEQTLSGVGSSIGPTIVYSWLDESGQQLGDDFLVNVDLPGEYFFSVLDQSNGCIAQDSVSVVSDFSTPTADAGSPLLLNCFNPTGELDGNASTSGPDIEYQWLDENDQNIGASVMLTIDEAGSYTLEVINTTSGCTDSDMVIVDEDFNSPASSAGPDQILNCDQPSLLLDGSSSSTGPDFSYQWQNLAGQLFGDQIDQSVDQADAYILEVINQVNGCSSQDTVVVAADFATPTVEAGAPQIINCFEPVAQLDGSNSSGSGDLIIEWQDAQSVTLGTTFTLSVDTEGWYYLLIENEENGCSGLDSVQITADFDEPIADAGVDGILTCADPVFVLDGSGSSTGVAFNYEWQDGNGMIFSTQQSPDITSAGSYTLTVFDNTNGCSNTDEAEVSADQEIPTASLNVQEELSCKNLNVILETDGSSTGAEFSYFWNTLSGGMINQGPLGTFVEMPGVYQLIVINTSNGCADTTQVTVNQDITPPQADAGEGLHLNCFLESGSLDGSSSGPAGQITYQWSTPDGNILDGLNTSSPTVDAAGNYQLTVTDLENGCIDSSTVVVTASFLEFFELQLSDPPCFNETGSLEITQVAGGVAPYTYSINGGGLFETQSFFPNLEAGVYEVVIQDADGCTLQQMTELIQPAPLELTIDPIVTIELGDAYQLEANINIPTDEIGSVSWSPAEGLSCVDCLDPLASPLDNTTYEITLIDTEGCRTVSEVLVKVDSRPRVYIPNIFSPDVDGDNERFLIFAADNHVREIRTFQIFTRWGEQVYQANQFLPNDPDYGWDGTFRGELMNPGVFVYFAEIEFLDGQVELFKGSVTLVR
jgi:gliding motility-associated-like protein